MVAWQLCAVVGLISLILEMCIPTMFFLSFAVGAFVASICAIYLTNWTALILIFAGVSLVSLLFLRPLLAKKTQKSQETGISAKYIGQKAKVVETVTENSGVISLYDERWQARADHEIPVGSDVEIERNDSLIMYVKETK